MLNRAGFDVVTAADAASGLRAFSRAHPAVILLDLRMPVVDGFELVRQIRERQNGRRVPVAVITGDLFLDDGIRQRLRSLDVEVHFKPLRFRDLVEIVEKLLEK